MNSFFKSTRFLFTCLGAGLGLVSCQYQELVEAEYPDQLIYLTTARNGVYTINSLATSNVATTGAYRYLVKADEKKIIVPLGVFRGGVTRDGAVNVDIRANADTVNRLLAANRLPLTTLLPADKYTLPTTVRLEDGQETASFNLGLDLDYLRANPDKKFAVGVSIASTERKANPLLNTTVVLVDASILKPVPNFTSKADAADAKKIAFTNASVNALRYSWDFGDGSTASPEPAPTYVYSKPGTYMVTLTATGLTGTADAVSKTATVTIL